MTTRYNNGSSYAFSTAIAALNHVDPRSFSIVDGRCDVTLVTCEAVPDLTRSDRALRHALESLGAAVRVAAWTDIHVDWSASPLTVIRSTWDACLKWREFESWLRRVQTQTRIANPVEKILWNMEKRYLLDLQERGIEIIPTVYFQAQSQVSLRQTDFCWRDVVVKPAIGASSYAVRRFSIPSELSPLEDHLSELVGRTGALVQRFEEAVTTHAERSLVFLGGEYSHAVRRLPFNTGDTPDSADFDHESNQAEIAFATRTLDAADCRMLPFARVDMVPGPTGLLLMELELIEPALFLTRSSAAARKLASIIAALL